MRKKLNRTGFGDPEEDLKGGWVGGRGLEGKQRNGKSMVATGKHCVW